MPEDCYSFQAVSVEELYAQLAASRPSGLTDAEADERR